MGKKIGYRLLGSNDLPAITLLVNSSYPLRGTSEFLRWQCFENINPVIIAGAFAEDNLIGMFGIQKRILSNGLTAGQLSWLNINPKWRGRGCFRELANFAINHFGNLDLICVFANANALLPCVNSLGMKIVGILKELNANLEQFKDGIESCTLLPVNNQSEFDCFQNSKIFFWKSKEFRIWRYHLRPKVDYFSLISQDGEFVIFKFFVDPLSGKSVGDLVEFGYQHNDLFTPHKLIKQACSVIKSNNISSASTWGVPGSTLRSVVDNLGFVETNHDCYFLVKIFNKSYHDLYDFSRWDLSFSDATNY